MGTTSKPFSLGPEWRKCSSEGNDCNFEGTRTVLYGAKNKFNTKKLTDGTKCSNQVFGDPIPGVVKSCWLNKKDAPTKKAPKPKQKCMNKKEHPKWNKVCLKLNSNKCTNYDQCELYNLVDNKCIPKNDKVFEKLCNAQDI